MDGGEKKGLCKPKGMSLLIILKSNRGNSSVMNRILLLEGHGVNGDEGRR